MKQFKTPSVSTRIKLAAVAAGLCLTTVGSLLGQSISNPGFEADNFGTYPGYISVNGPITGWTGSPADRVGINPAGGQSPFVNNGAIPNGSKAAFLQSYTGGSATLSTEITGLTAGQKYTVNFRFNARTNNPAQTPLLKIGIDGQPIVNLSTMGVQIGGTTTPYRYGAFDFTAAGASAMLWLTNDVNGDTTLLVDDFSINPSTNGWSFAPWTGDADAVDNTKNYTHAYNFGGTAVPDTTINGVLFKGVVGANPILGNDFWIQGLGQAYGSDDANNVTSGGSAAMAKRFIYAGNPGYFSIGGLVPGMEYIATFYTMAWETGFRAQTFSYGNDRLTVNQDQYNDNNGIRISYRYIAPANGAITLMQTPTLSANSLHLYGFANCEANPQTLPVMGIQPRDQVTTVGATAVFRVTAGGARPLSYQWYKNGSLLDNQTNRSLVVSNLTLADGGPYYVVVSNSFGTVTSSSANLTFGTIANPSFEADVFHGWPGYISGNSPISGWTASNPGRVGLNPMPDYVGPFANNGAVPDGAQVAFIQSTGTNWLSTVLDGMTPGQKYTLTFRANGRSSGQKPTVRAAIDGQQIGEFRGGQVDGTSAYRFIAFDFTPAGASAVLYLTNDAAGDHTVLLDDFRIAPSITKWSYAAWNDDASSGVDSTKAYSHAYNVGGAGLAVDTTINGVRFIGVPGANPAVNNQFSLTNFTGVFAAHSNLLTSVGGGSAALAQSFVYYAGDIPAEARQTIILSNLIPGVEYLATIYGVGFDIKSFARSATFTAGNDRSTINEDNFGLHAGIRVSYPYIADPSGTMVLTYVPTDRASSFHTYGFSNQELNSTNPPSFYRQPQGRVVAGGSTVILVSAVGGQGPLSLQWQKDGVNLVDQTNLVLTLAGVTGADTGNYTLVASNPLGVVTSAVARVDVGLAMVNPSFEVDSFTNYPGYIAGNFPITGWTASQPVQTGLNPVSDGRSPFADNGTIPDGAKVAFIQIDGGTLSQVITGMVPGQTYYLQFYENYRSAYAKPSLTVTLGGVTIVPTHVVNTAGYTRVVSGPFLATTDSAELAFIKTAGPAGADSTVVFDNVAVLDLPPTPPTFLQQPQSIYLKAGDTLALSTFVQGTLPMNYQWQRDGVDVTDATNATLSLSGVLMSQAGSYSLIVSNAYGITTSSVAVVRVGQAISELFNTGVDETGALLAGGAVDAHYPLISSPDPAYPGPATFVLNDVWPATNGVYMTNGPLSKWLSPRLIDPVDRQGNVDGLYIYRTSFVLESLDPTTAEIRGAWAMDNYGMDVLLNGVSLGLTNISSMFTNLTPFTITSGFVAGSNTLDFVISNSPPAGPTALRVELYGVAMPLPPGPPQIVSEPASKTAIELQDLSLSVLALGSGPLSYQWYYEGFDLQGANGRTLSFARVSADQAGNYWVVISNNFGAVTSQVATLNVLVPPQIVTEPLDQTVELGEPVTFSVVAAGTEPMFYQWYFGSALLTNETNPDLAVASVGLANLGTYFVVVSNAAGSVTSSVVTLALNNVAPVAGALTVATSVNRPLTVAITNLLGRCSDPDGDALTLDSVATSSNGAVVTIVGEDIVYTPVADFVGLNQFSYSISDGRGGTATGTVSVEVYPGNLAILNLTGAGVVTGGFRITFAGIPGRSYSVERALEITGPWTNIATVVGAPAGLTPFVDPAPATNAFYRVTYP